MRKSVLKRIKFTKNGKIIHRMSGQNHFRAKKTSENLRAKRRTANIDSHFRKLVIQNLKSNH